MMTLPQVTKTANLRDISPGDSTINYRLEYLTNVLVLFVFPILNALLLKQASKLSCYALSLGVPHGKPIRLCAHAKDNVKAT